MEINKDNIKEIIGKVGINPNKDKGQNFLIDPDVCKVATLSLDITDKDCVVEIGPGLGSLTNFLYKKTKDLTLVEIDSTFLQYLKDEYPNAKIINENGIKCDYKNYNKIISNIPYSVTTPLIEQILLNSNAEKYVFMVQKEVYVRFASIKGSEYCPLSVFMHLIGDIKKELVVKPNCFVPSPKCDSVIFSLIRRTNEDFSRTYKITKKLFLNRRKTISNNLLQIVKDKELVSKILFECDVPSNMRVDDISYDKFRKIDLLVNKYER